MRLRLFSCLSLSLSLPQLCNIDQVSLFDVSVPFNIDSFTCCVVCCCCLSPVCARVFYYTSTYGHSLIYLFVSFFLISFFLCSFFYFTSHQLLFIVFLDYSCLHTHVGLLISASFVHRTTSELPLDSLPTSTTTSTISWRVLLGSSVKYDNVDLIFDLRFCIQPIYCAKSSLHCRRTTSDDVDTTH